MARKEEKLTCPIIIHHKFTHSFIAPLLCLGASLAAEMVKNLPEMQEIWV